MNYGLYLSASGVLTSLYRQDVFANNLANVTTAGFKPQLATIRQRSAEAVEDNLGLDVSQKLLDQLGGGSLAGPARYDFAPGALRFTGKPLDLAIPAPDQFLVVEPASNPGQTALSRVATFTLNSDGQLVTAQGHAVLDDHGNTIDLDPDADVTISGAGQVSQNGEAVAQLQVVRANNLANLRPVGGNLFNTIDQTDLSAATEVVDTPDLRVGFVEQSGVDSIATLTGMIEANRAVTANSKLMQYHNQLMQQAVSTLGRVA